MTRHTHKPVTTGTPYTHRWTDDRGTPRWAVQRDHLCACGHVVSTETLSQGVAR